MKTENNLELKAKFFALYFGQKVFHCSLNQKVPHKNTFGRLIKSRDRLELTPLSQISDEDAIEVFNLLLPDSNDDNDGKIFFGKTYVRSYDTNDVTLKTNHTYLETQRLIDYLRSKGYALPYLGISVEEQISRGWIKLKEEK
jgi:hypothetical protein